MPKLTDIKPASRFFGMFVSHSGHGKTCAALSFPNPFAIDMDMRIRGGLAIRDWVSEEQYNSINFKSFPPGTGFKDVEKELELLEAQIKTNSTPTQTVIFESLTSENRLLLAESRDITDSSGKQEIKTRIIGKLSLMGPANYGYEAEGTYQLFEWLRALPINVIVSAHIVDRYGKAEKGNEYSETIVVGEKLSVRDKIGENVLIYFDEVYKFRKEEQGDGKLKFYVKFRDGDIAKTCYTNLPSGWVDITNKNFYETWKELISK